VRKECKFQYLNLKGRDDIANTGVDRRIILKRILRKHDVEDVNWSKDMR
jgi:hypothetical protein